MPTTETTPRMRSTFEPRRLPEAIFLRDEAVILGPFCVHCGAPESDHDADGHCPGVVSPLYPAPACTCHGIVDKELGPIRLHLGEHWTVVRSNGVQVELSSPSGESMVRSRAWVLQWTARADA